MKGWFDRLRARVWWACMVPVVLVLYPLALALGVLDEERVGLLGVLREMWQMFKRGEA